jgi:uncharacterized UBP type Zn finger protein
MFTPLIRRSTSQYRMKSQTMIANLPDILCIQLKRFTFDRVTRTATKLTTPILLESEQILDLSSVHYKTWLGLSHSSDSFRYRLNSICLHLSEHLPSSSSSMSTIEVKHDHYVCLYRSDRQRWFLTDDERITEINNINNLLQTTYVTENCYLLFYERC